MPTITIDNRPVSVAPGATVLDAARSIGIDIPALCHRQGCAPNTSCLACVVKINGSARLVPSCATPAVEGMNVESETPFVHEARRTALELLLADHAGDCEAPCENVCPAHMDIPTMISQIHAGEMRQAIGTVKRHIALPAILGRICPELCEKGCRRGQLDASVSICMLKRHVADTDLATGQPYLPACRAASGKAIAIVGTGPAGLAAAWELLQLGHACVLYDHRELPGGNLRYAVPEEKLPRDVVDAEVGLIRRLGAEFRMGSPVGRQLTVQQLRKEFDAVLMAVGEVDAARAGELGLAMAGKGLKVDRKTLMGAIDGVFVAGAALTPYRHAIRACADGRSAALAMDQYVRGEPISPVERFSVRLGVLSDDEFKVYAGGTSTDARVSGNGQGFVPDQAVAESARCLHCDCAKLEGCTLRRWSMVYGAEPSRYKMERKPYERVETHPEVVYEPGKCIACGLCVQIATRSSEPLGLTFIGRGLRVRVGVPFDKSMSAALQQVAQECIDACPTAALSRPRKLT